MRNAWLPTLLLLAATSAHAGRVDQVEVSASSSYPPEQGFTYDARMAADGKLATSWVEGDEGSGLGSWMSFDFGEETTLTAVKVWGGMWYSYNFWNRGNRPKKFELKYDDGSKDVFELPDEMHAKTFELPAAKKTKTVRLKILDIHAGTTWLDTAFSEVQFFDDQSDAGIKGYGVSSRLAADADGNYEPVNMSDGVVDSMWCEGSKEGDGTDEWVQVDFKASRKVSKMTLINGVGGNIGAWMKSNRAESVQLTFSDGSTETVELKNSISPQTVSFPAHDTASVRLTFKKVAKGMKYNDLCVSELSFE